MRVKRTKGTVPNDFPKDYSRFLTLEASPNTGGASRHATCVFELAYERVATMGGLIEGEQNEFI